MLEQKPERPTFVNMLISIQESPDCYVLMPRVLASEITKTGYAVSDESGRWRLTGAGEQYLQAIADKESNG